MYLDFFGICFFKLRRDDVYEYPCQQFFYVGLVGFIALSHVVMSLSLATRCYANFYPWLDGKLRIEKRWSAFLIVQLGGLLESAWC